MALDPVSVALGFVGAYVFCVVAFIAMCVNDERTARKERERELDRLLTEVAIRCLEHPKDWREF